MIRIWNKWDVISSLKSREIRGGNGLYSYWDQSVQNFNKLVTPFSEYDIGVILKSNYLLWNLNALRTELSDDAPVFRYTEVELGPAWLVSGRTNVFVSQLISYLITFCLLRFSVRHPNNKKCQLKWNLLKAYLTHEIQWGHLTSSFVIIGQ